MRIDEIIKYLEMNQYQDLNYKILSQEESKKLVFYIRYLETQVMKYDKYIYDKEVIWWQILYFYLSFGLPTQ